MTIRVKWRAELWPFTDLESCIIALIALPYVAFVLGFLCALEAMK